MHHTMTRQQAEALLKFLARWLAAVVPGLRTFSVTREGCVEARDTLGWRKVGTIDDFVPLARALGALQ